MVLNLRAFRTIVAAAAPPAMRWIGTRLAVCLLLCGAPGASASHARRNILRQRDAGDAGHADGFVRALEFKHRLRVCNAYPYAAALDVYRSKEKLTGAAPMPYKECRDFLSPLMAGDKLEFKVGDANAGTFSVSDLPNNDAVLLLVIHRHDTLSTAVSFESHVFANLLNAQIAIIDTYKGAARSSMKIMDGAGSNAKAKSRSEDLRYNSVVAVNPGIYEVELSGNEGSSKAKSELVALDRQSYVILRTGVEAQQGPSYPQELVIYPRSAVSALRSGAATAGPRAVLLALLVALTAASAWPAS